MCFNELLQRQQLEDAQQAAGPALNVPQGRTLWNGGVTMANGQAAQNPNWAEPNPTPLTSAPVSQGTLATGPAAGDDGALLRAILTAAGGAR